MPESRSLPFFDDAACARVVRELRETGGAAAQVYGKSAAGEVDPAVRKATRLVASTETSELVRSRLLELREQLANHFAINLGDPQEPQFLRYRVGDSFVAHQDGNTPLLRDESLLRRVSVSIFLNAGYSGGTLILHGEGAERIAVEPVPGSLVAFRSEMTHEVTPVTDGERYAIVTWYPQRDAQEVVVEEIAPQIDAMRRARAAATLPRIIEFIRSIGIEVREAPMHRRTLVAGIDLDGGGLVIERERLCMPADLLHEAAHIALTPASHRHLVDGTMDGTAAEEIAAIAWTWAAARFLGLDEEDVFHQEVISGNGPTLLENFRDGRFVGVPMLQYLGLANDEKHATKRGTAPYPHMLRWLRD